MRYWLSLPGRPREQERTPVTLAPPVPNDTAQARYHDLGPDWHARHINRDKKITSHLRGLRALGVTVTITADKAA